MLASASATQQPSLHPPPPNSMAYLGEWFHQHSINRITPHDISIAVLIDIMSNQDSFNNTTLSNTSDASTNKFIINCIQHEHTPIFGTINRFITELTNVNPDLVQPFISTFSSIDSIDTLFTLFDQFKTIEVNKTSIYGIFLRKIILIFNNLLFDGVKTLFDNIMKYKSNQPMLLLNNDTIECTFSNTGNNTFHRSSKHTNNNNNTLHPTGLSSVSKIFPKLYYHNYIQSCKELDFMNANFFLHIYYDYFQNRSYSALNKSLLYYHFKYYKQATISLKESIKIAQQNNEHESLLLSLIILYKIKMIEYFHNESKNVELFILQALKFAQTQQNKSLSFISFYITLDYIQFKLLTGFHDQEITKQLYLLLKKCEQVSFQEFPIQQQQLYSKPLLLKELFPKSLLNHVKSHFYRFMGDRLLYQCHLRLKSGVGGSISGSINGSINGSISGSIGIGNHSNTLRSPLTSPIRSSSTASQGNHNHWIQSPIQSPLSSPLQSPSSKSSSTALVPLGLTRDVLDLYSDYELLSSKSIPNSDHTCYRLIIVHFIQLQDRENVNILMNQFRNIMDPSLNIDKCDLLYLNHLYPIILMKIFIMPSLNSFHVLN
ncbi:hypothetical protein C9374_001982 [Naegleria lovaniensis]|uniref:Anaphase-promoting complex subunit 5 n=1 Tax=Naegleria lovaniensis TaxID=51637 RepID=A0AA88GQD4_NAELO|nr:uncharacterized protein C9374_001982 [Naegleria lovaniensis]KAG2386947.1 hypothetical protein C9374_001982 [Naegleria lovaniensis]